MLTRDPWIFFQDVLDRFQGEMKGNTPQVQQMSAITSLWHFSKMAACRFHNYWQWNKKGNQLKSSNSVHTRKKVIQLLITWCFCTISVAWVEKKHLKRGQKKWKETGKDTWRREEHLEAVRLCSRWDLRRRLSHSSFWLLWFIKAPSTLTWGCCKKPHQFRIKSLAGFRWARFRSAICELVIIS